MTNKDIIKLQEDATKIVKRIDDLIEGEKPKLKCKVKNKYKMNKDIELIQEASKNVQKAIAYLGKLIED